MKIKRYTSLLVISCTLLTLAACSPPEPPQENVLAGYKKSLDKARHVEKIGFEHKEQMDNIERQAN